LRVASQQLESTQRVQASDKAALTMHNLATVHGSLAKYDQLFPVSFRTCP